MAATGDLLDLFRTEMRDTAAPYLWSDEFIFGAIDDAQKWFCRKTDGISDSTTSAVTQLAVTPGATTFTLHPSILKIRSARRGDTGRPVAVINEEDMPTHGWYFDGSTGPLRALVTGMDESGARPWPVPNETVTVNLSVFRLPLVAVVDDQTLEIAPQHHRSLLLWVKHLAYLVQDAETFDRSKADEFEAAFEAYCFKAKQEQGRLQHKPRAVVYGGI